MDETVNNDLSTCSQTDKDPNHSSSVELTMHPSLESSDGKRMRCLRSTMNKTIKALIIHLRLVEPISNASPAALKHMNDEMKTQLERNTSNDFEMMYEEENIISLLNGLDKMTENMSQSLRTRWRPSGNVEADIRTHTATLKSEQLQVLEKTLSDLEAQNKLLQEKEQKREKRLLRTRDKIASLVASTEQITQQEKSSVEETFTKLQTLNT